MTAVGLGLAAAVADSAASARGQSPAARPPIPGAPAGITAFVNVNVVPMDTERVLTDQTVLVEGGRITALKPSGKASVPANAVRIDGRGKYLMPGLGECHAHLGLFVKKTNDTVAAEHALLLMLAAGVTTLRNLDYTLAYNALQLDGPTLLRLRARAAAGELWSPRIYTSAAWWGNDSLAERTRPEDVPRYIAAYKAAGYDFIKVRDEGRATLAAVMAAARQVGIPVIGHPPSYLPIEQALTLGYASLEHGLEYIHEIGDTILLPARAAAAKTAGVWNCLTVRGSLRIAKVAKALQDAGAGILLGTDAPVDWRMGFSVHRELALLVRAGLTPYQALLTGTRNLAQHLGTLDESGTVSVGKRADLVLLTGNPLDNIWHTLDQAGVMVGGRWLTPEVVAQRLAALDPQGETLPELVLEQQKLFYADEAEAAVLELWTYGGVGDQLSDAQSDSLYKIAPAYHTALAALLDSVVPGTDTAAARRRVFRLVTRRLEAQRAVLTPEQQTVFDARARAWMQRYAD